MAPREIPKEIAHAIANYARVQEHFGSCGDGGCLVKKPVGMHTNGGCKCNTDKHKAQHMMWAGQQLFNAIMLMQKEK